MRRRDFIALLGGAAAWSLAARAQQDGRVRRIGLLAAEPEDDQISQARRAAFGGALAQFGWLEGRNLRTELRFGAADLERTRAQVAELVSHAPDIIVTTSGATTVAAQRATGTIPIVFTQLGDPQAAGVVRNMARPEGNTTGFATYDPVSAESGWSCSKKQRPM